MNKLVFVAISTSWIGFFWLIARIVRGAHK
jgi:hypothetical protein